MTARSIRNILAAAALASTPAFAGSASVQQALQTNYDRISAAFRSHQFKAVEAMMGPDVTLTTPTHETWKRDRILSDLRRQSAMIKDATWRRNVAAVTVHGNQAVATVRGKLHAIFAGQGGKGHTFDLTSLSVDTWVRHGNKWQLKHADTRELHPQIDGQAMPDRAMNRK
jgi:ketosteroid isomerase-like protein